ncbi:hypothetical protein BLNAU_17354 [Blattamonas nauphoetae]|uniref:Protein kinase domain-containing protein n=1 Tax=Blattamonas nauphoetae TaxID=2049346 RepID=A0ABQ9X7J0_9EUKA|nr:hypothetical protein BLNAU_17354 [Blattamonas nauphoetae]
MNPLAKNMVSPICPTIFALCNSTFSLERIHFSSSNENPDTEAISDQNTDGRIAVLDSSDLTLSFCELSLRYSLSPFVIQHSDNSEGGQGTSLLINKCTLRSDSGMIRGLLELPANQSSHSGHTISIVGVAFSNTEIVGADGVSLSLRGAPASDGPVSVLSVSLIENRFQNMSTSRHIPNPIWAAGLTQRMVCCVVSETSSHLTGSTLRDVHFGGSLLCSNTSFSALLSSLDQNDAETGTVDMPDETSHDFVDGTRYTFTADSGGEATATVFTGCVFTGAKYPTNSVTLLKFTDFKGTVKLTKCRVLNVNVPSSSLVAVSNSAQQGGFTCTDCVFDQFNGSGSDCVFSFHDCQTISFTGCTFTDTVLPYSSGTTGAITISNDVSKVNIYNFLFSNNEFSHLMYRGIYLTNADYTSIRQSGEIKVTQCLFDDCHGDYGNGLGQHFFALTTITHCKFTSCSSNSGYGEGALSVYGYEICYISDIEVTDCHNSGGGGLHFNLRRPANLEHCTVKNCRSDNDGGGMCFTAYQTYLIIDCHFIDCSSAKSGGGVSVSNSYRTEIIKCSFTRCSGNEGSAILTSVSGNFVVTDCLIQNCSTHGFGGAIGYPLMSMIAPKLTLTRVIFAHNKADTQTIANPFVDVFLSMMKDAQMDITVEDCFTFDEGQLAGNILITPDPFSYTFHNLDIFETKGPKLTKTAGGLIDQYTGEVRISLGALVPLVEQEYDVTMTKEGAAGDVTMRVRIENGVTKPNWISNTETTVLEYSTKYTITKIVGVVPLSESTSNAVFKEPKVAWEFDLTATPSFVSFTTPSPPPILSVSCEDGLGTDHAWIQLTGMSIEEGTYTVALDGTTFTFDVTFSGPKDSNGQYKSSKASVRLFGAGSKLTFAKQYRLKSVTDKSTSIPVNLVGMIINFTTPVASSRLTTIGVMNLIGDQKDEVSVQLYGANLKATQYFIETSPSSEVSGEKLSVVFSESSGTLVGKVYSVSGNGVALEYGRTYSITKMTNAENDAVLFVPLSFTVPDEPARLANVSLTVDANMNTSTLTLTTRQLAAGEKYVVNLSGTPTEPSGSNEGDEVEFEVDGGDVIASRLDLYPTATIKFGHSYEVTSMTLKSGTEPILRNAGNCSFSTPAEPTRIENGTCRLNADRTKVIVEFTGRALKTGPYNVVVTHIGGSETYNLDGTLNSDGSIHCSHTASLNDPDFLIFEETYTITSATLDTKPILCNTGIDLTIPQPPKVTGAGFNFANSLNTTCSVTLTGTNLNLSGNYSVALQNGPTITVPFTADKTAISSTLLIGPVGCLQFSTTYTIARITRDDNADDVVVVVGEVTLKTEAKPTNLTIFVDEETGYTDSTCGDSTRPCPSVDASWRIASSISISKVQMRIVKSAVQAQSISIPSDGFLILTKAQLGGPTLRIPSTASAGESEGMVVVNGGSVDIREIVVLIENQSDSFVFLFGMNSSIQLTICSIVGSAQTSNSNTSSDDLCNWPSGMLRLLNCTSTVTSSQLTHLSQGAINLEGGRLTVESSAFHDNSPNSTAFPSFRRNIRCSGQGEVTIESLSGGDGLLAGTSAWVSEEECSLKGEHAQRDTPLFIPTLSDSSKCELDSKTKVFSVEVKGEVLIPCGLWLEVVEWTKDKKEGKNVTFELSLATCLSLTENLITLHLAQSLLSSLDTSLEWRGRLIFGNGVRSANSFVFQKSSADRLAQSVKQHMKWWLPLAIVIAAALLITIILVVLCRRRRKTQKSMKDNVSAEMDEEILEKLEDPEDRDTLGRTYFETSHRHLNSEGIPAEPPSVRRTTRKSEEMPSLGLEAVEVLVCGEASKVEIVLKKDTLFERLHGMTKQPVDAVEVGKAIVKGLRHLNKSDMFLVSLAKWTPHWILFDSKDRVCLRLNEETNQTQLDLNGYSVVTDEGERWRAPEQANGQLTVNAERASVFRLGLVLLEMRTGIVPFGEIDATNASRQLCSGLLPPHSQIDEDFMSIVHDCLTLTPADRPLLFEIEEKLAKYNTSHAGQTKEHKLMDAEPGDVFHSRPNESVVDH